MPDFVTGKNSMGKPNTRASSAEEKKALKRENEKKRYARIKNNPELYAEYKEKNRLKYQKRKEQKKVVPIKEMTPKQQKIQRQKWRNNFNAYYHRKKEHMAAAMQFIDCNSPPASPPQSSSDINLDPIDVNNVQCQKSTRSSPHIEIYQAPSLESTSSSCTDSPSSKLRKLRYKKDKHIANLEQELNGIKKINEAYKKRITKLEKITPNQQNLLRDGLLKSYKELKSNTAKQQLSAVLENNVKVDLKQTGALGNLKSLFRRRLKISVPAKKIKVDVRRFFESDAISSMAAGKKEFVKKHGVRKQRRYLTDTIYNAYKSFISSHNCKLSYATFCRLRPFWVVFASQRPTDQCLCIIHENFQLFASALHSRKIIGSKDVLGEICCDKNKVECLSRKCKSCMKTRVTYLEFDNSIAFEYWSWINKSENIISNGIEKTIKVVKKEKLVTEPKKAIEIFEQLLNKFIEHCINMRSQQHAIHNLKDQLKSNEAIIHIDFSENYKCQYTREIQSAHFGGSKKQISLHTCVLYFFTENYVKQTQCFATVSPNIRHDAAAVWAHLDPVVEYLKETSPHIDTLHFVSDSATSQYRNYKIFFIVTSLKWNFPNLKSLTWNYTEAGHGKGAPDGVGAVLKRTADRVVSQGQDVANFESFVYHLRSNIENILIKEVFDHAILEKDVLLPANLRPFKGTQKVHQIIWHESKRYQVTLRKLNCPQDSCVKKPVVCCHGMHLGFHDINFSSSMESAIDKPKNSNRESQEVSSMPKIHQKVNILSDITISPPKLKTSPDFDNCIESFKLPTGTSKTPRPFYVSSKENVPVPLNHPIALNKRKFLANHDDYLNPTTSMTNNTSYTEINFTENNEYGDFNDVNIISNNISVAPLKNSKAFCALSKEDLPEELIGDTVLPELQNFIHLSDKELSENFNADLFNAEITDKNTLNSLDNSIVNSPERVCYSNESKVFNVHVQNQHASTEDAQRLPEDYNEQQDITKITVSLTKCADKATDINTVEEYNNDFPYKSDMWVLVQYETKMKAKYYIGLILDIDQNNVLEVNFLRKSSRLSNNVFTWPQATDKDFIRSSNIVKILNVPKVNRRGQYIFENLNLYSIE